MKVNSAIGAGDSFMGGMCAGLVRGQSVSEAGTLGMAAAAATLLTPGTDSAIPRMSSACAARSRFLNLSDFAAGASTALFSNTALAYQLGRVRNWVAIYFHQDSGTEGQRTVVT